MFRNASGQMILYLPEEWRVLRNCKPDNPQIRYQYYLQAAKLRIWMGEWEEGGLRLLGVNVSEYNIAYQQTRYFIDDEHEYMGNVLSWLYGYGTEPLV
jgi:hypothetical protein